MNLIIQALRKLNLTNVRIQVTAELESGEEIRVMSSNGKWHVGFGEQNSYSAAIPMSEREAAERIESA